ncbi:hypothetical protein JCM4814A_76100 [Streptomyces phaeofaciens JCM 4814]|uniref:Uncharacterized protein n=1 Tax=Streptomyces phaeofaciens TaxID=68254 RepID=A0A918HJ57_9ACTN|nr:hypothetical protein [Streptomyces phaeofaciens]GGT64964.1 hypothetical protein GCM10010226_48540 [Streptomyces phaeofaciens]
MRLRIRVTHWPRRALVLTDTPHPRCPNCQGEGGTEQHYGDHTGEYAGTDWDVCPCWNDTRRLVLLPLRRRRTDDGAPWAPAGYSDKAPF